MNKVWLLAVRHPEDSHYFEREVQETQALIEACELVCDRVLIQNLKQASSFYAQKGKIEEIRQALIQEDMSTLVTHSALSPAQHRNLSEALGCEVLDRTQIILEIFQRRATSKESKLQVEHARLSYLLPRTKLAHGSTGRQQGGALRTRGAGEQALALRQRILEKDLQKIQRQLKSLNRIVDRQAHKRQDQGVFTVALIGYTNAGKSTLMNHLVQRYGVEKDKTVSAKDQVFESLQTAARRLQIDGRDLVLIDTVGFIRKLPKALNQAFHATFVHAQTADVLVHVIDGSAQDLHEQEATVLATLSDLNMMDHPMLTVRNKVDLMDEAGVGISALMGFGIKAFVDQLCRLMDTLQPSLVLKLPYAGPLSFESLKRTHQINLISSDDQGQRVRVLHMRECPKAWRSFQIVDDVQ